ncbi:MAG: chemotaxis response regulator protein-glutamate methylesterase [Myxococcota bacterium]
MSSKIRVLIVDDSALIRSLLSKTLSTDPELEVVGAAKDPYEARDMLVRLKPDVLTLDVEMPKMDGVTFLKKLMGKMPIPTVMLSTLTEKGAAITVEALEAGAVDILTKPKNLVDGVPAMAAELCQTVKRAARVKVRKRAAPMASSAVENPLENSTDKVIAIGASTGGVEAIARILPKFPKSSPGIVIVIHMPEAYTGPFAARLNKTCAMEVREAKPKDRIRAGVALVAPGGKHHLVVQRFGGQYRVGMAPPSPKDPHVPGVDHMFLSVAKAAGANAVGVILTGMGDDGARGMMAMKNAGAPCFAQDEASCVVFGMPKVALQSGAAERAVPLDLIPKTVLDAFRAQGGKPKATGTGR